MKKFFALMIALVMVLSCAAFAEEVEFNVEEMYEGVWIQFPDDGFEMYLPGDWLELEIDEELTETSGHYYAIASPDGSMTFQLAWTALEAEMDLEALLADVQTIYPEAELLTIGNVDAVCFADGDVEVLTFALLDEVDLGVYYFNFTPTSSEEAVAYATVMMSSIRPLEVAE